MQPVHSACAWSCTYLLQPGSATLTQPWTADTSASLSINENASPDVPLDLADTLDRIVPEGRMYRHLDEGVLQQQTNATPAASAVC